MNTKNAQIAVFAALAIFCMAAICMAPVFENDDEPDGAAISHTYDVFLKPGESYQLTNTVTSSSDYRVAVADNGTTAITTSNGTYSDYSESTSSTKTNGIASVTKSSTGYTLKITTTSGTAAGIHYVGVKVTTAATLKPQQSAIDVYIVHVISPTLSYGSSISNAKVGTAVTAITPTIGGMNGTYTKAFADTDGINTDTGLTFGTTDGKVSGTPSKANSTKSAHGTYTVTLTITPGKTSGSSAVYSSASTYTVTAEATVTTYAVASNQTTTANGYNGAANTTGIAAYTNADWGTIAFQSATYTYKAPGASSAGSATNITAGTAFSGITVANTGKVTWTNAAIAGTYVITETYKITETNQTFTYTITLTIEQKLNGNVQLASTTLNKYTGNATSGTAMTTASSKVTLVGSATWSVSDTTNFAIGTDGKITAKKALAAKDYTVTVTYTSALNSANKGTATLTVHVDAPIALSTSEGSAYYGITNDAYLDETYGMVNTFTNTAAMYGGSKTVSYTVTEADATGVTKLVQDTDYTLSNGVLTFLGNCQKVGTHTLTLKATDDAVSANNATRTITFTVVAAITTGTPNGSVAQA